MSERTAPAPSAGSGATPDNPVVPYDPAFARRQERLVRRGFWRKIRQVAGKVPFVEDAVAAYYCVRDPDTPTSVRAVLIGALAYFIMPADAIPDVIAGFGFTDDAAVMTAALTAVGSSLRDRHMAAARAWLGRR